MELCKRVVSSAIRVGRYKGRINLVRPALCRQMSVLASDKSKSHFLHQHSVSLANNTSRRNLSTLLKDVNTRDADELLSVTWKDGSTAEYSYVWLRDSCLCPKCHEPSAKSRLLRMQDLPVDCKPSSVEVQGSELVITWDDGHVSPYPLDWLEERGYTPSNIERRTKVWPLPATSWGRELLEDLPKDSYQNLINDDRALYEWISKMERFGFFIITDAPSRTGCLEEFAKRVAFLRFTNYGQSFTVKAKIDPSNAAYTTAALGLHVDLPYYYYTPGVQMLHCIQQVPTKGGENQFADGFYVAEVVKKLRPDYYETLCTALVDFYDIGTDYYKFHKFTRRPVIQFDTMGNMTQINYNNQVRDYFSHLPAKEMTALLKAMKFFDDVMYRQENHIEVKLQDGEIACFHNYRVMHGRESFQALEGGERHYEGGYLDWDELHSRRRVLQQELNL